MAQTKPILCTISAAMLAGCVGNAQIARSDFEYLDEKSREPLLFPEHLDPPPQSNDFNVPKVAEAQQKALGDKLIITPPLQVLTLVDGSIRPQDGQRASIEFDVTAKEGDNPVDQIWASVRAYLAAHKIETQIWNADDGLLVTGWHLAHSEKDPSLFWGLEDYFVQSRGELQVKARFAFHVALSPSGRTAKLTATMPEFQRYLGGKLERSIPTDLERDNLTVNFLNGAVMQYQKDVAALRVKKSKAERRAMHLSLQTNEKEGATIIVAAPFEQVWPHVEPVLVEAGFEVEDKDKVQATYYVNAPGQGMFSFLGFGRNELDIEPGDYKLLFGDKGGTTSINLFDEESLPVSKETMETVYHALKLAIIRHNQERESEPAKPNEPAKRDEKSSKKGKKQKKQ